MLNELYTFAETCSGGPFFKSKMGEIYFTTYNYSEDVFTVFFLHKS